MSYEVNADGWDVERGTLGRADRAKGGWEIGLDPKGWVYWLQDKDAAGITPRVGDAAVFFTSNLSLVRGIEINGKRLLYVTRKQADRDAVLSRQRRERKAQRELDAERPDRDRRRAALPEPLRARLDRYEAANPVWRREYESYELFVCEQAADLAALPKTGDLQVWYDRFRDLGYEEQRKEWPGLSPAHSGNTFGAAVQLAYFLERGWRDRIVNGHGAMVALVGCAEYGCHVEPVLAH